jgi:hypothetical protein
MVLPVESCCCERCTGELDLTDYTYWLVTKWIPRHHPEYHDQAEHAAYVKLMDSTVRVLVRADIGYF